MDLQPVVQEIRSFMTERARPEMAARYARYFREGYDAYGLQSGEIEELQKKLLDRYKKPMAWQGFYDLGDLLMKDGKYEEIMLAILLAAAYKKQVGKEALQRWGAWLDQGITTWAHTDVMCKELLNYFWQQGLMELEDIGEWRQASSKWKRRAVPVSLLALLRKGFSIEDLLDFIDPMMPDEQRVVQQGLGWFLREAWKKHPLEVEEYLFKWRETAPRLIYQYATEKMSREARERFRRPRKNQPER